MRASCLPSCYDLIKRHHACLHVQLGQGLDKQVCALEQASSAKSVDVNNLPLPLRERRGAYRGEEGNPRRRTCINFGTWLVGRREWSEWAPFLCQGLPFCLTRRLLLPCENEEAVGTRVDIASERMPCTVLPSHEVLYGGTSLLDLPPIFILP